MFVTVRAARGTDGSVHITLHAGDGRALDPIEALAQSLVDNLSPEDRDALLVAMHRLRNQRLEGR